MKPTTFQLPYIHGNLFTRILILACKSYYLYVSYTTYSKFIAFAQNEIGFLSILTFY
uniref:Uncharacterized protein n=1 Tax=Manihot esculenta TaxID=3983 RepID=A0A2C9W545_MANES